MVATVNKVEDEEEKSYGSKIKTSYISLSLGRCRLFF